MYALFQSFKNCGGKQFEGLFCGLWNVDLSPTAELAILGV